MGDMEVMVDTVDMEVMVDTVARDPLMLMPMHGVLGMAVDMADTVMVVDMEDTVDTEDTVDIVAREKPKLNQKLNLKPPLLPPQKLMLGVLVLVLDTDTD